MKKEWILFPAAAVLALLAILTWRQTAYWKDDFTLYSRGVQVNPNNAIAHNNLGQTYADRGMNLAAIEHFLAAVRISENHFLAWGNLARAYKKINENGKAIECYIEMLKFEPDSAELHYALGELYAGRNNHAKAFEEFSRAVSLNPRDAAAFYNLGIVSAKMGNAGEAMRYLSSALELNPRDADAHLALGMMLLDAKRGGEAAGHFKEVVQLKPENQEARNLLDAALHGKGGGPASPGAGGAAAAEDAKALFRAAVEHSSKGEYAHALEALNRLRVIQPDNPDVYYNIACVYARQGKVDESVSWLRKALEKGFKDWKLLSGDKDLDTIRGSKGYRELISQKKG